MNSKHNQCAVLAYEALQHLQSIKIGELSAAIRKLELIARLTNDKPLLRWCKFHFGEYEYEFLPLKKGEVDQEYANQVVKKIKKLKIPVSSQEIIPRLSDSGGGFNSIETIEQILERLDKKKRGNDGTHYMNNLQNTISSCANAAAKYASRIYSTYSFGDIPRQQFDIIRERVDELLLDICPDVLMAN